MSVAGRGRLAERVFLRGRILTGDPECPRAGALAVAAGRVLVVGDEDSVLAVAGPDTEVVPLDGRTVTPGFHDAHIHLSAGSLTRTRLDLRGTRGIEEVVERVQARARSLPAKAWIRGFGWDQTRWPIPGWPDHHALDGAAPEHPVLLTRVDGHAAWLNGRALELLGLGRHTADPPGGAILRDARSGDPTGILLERAAEGAVAALPEETDAERRRALEEALADLATLGITSIEDVAQPWAVPLYAALREEGRLTARISVWLPLETDRAEAEGWRERFPPGDPWLSVSTLKVFLDGTLGSRSAALNDPYADEPGSRGILRVDPAWLAEQVREADARDWAVAMHAIGDRAVGVALDALEALPRRARSRPHRIEHVQVVAATDLPRFAACGAVASVQPVHLLDDGAWIEGRLGGERAAHAYPYRSLLRAGAIVAMGTDWPIAPMDPRLGLAAAAGATGPGSWSEAITVAEALEAYAGRLCPGHAADITVLSENPLDLDPEEIPHRLKVLGTYLGGRRIHPDIERFIGEDEP